MRRLDWDVLVVGCGAAGLRAAIEARQERQTVCLLTPSPPGWGTSTIMSHGVFAGAGDVTHKLKHRESTLAVGRGLNQETLVEVLVEEAPQRLEEMVRWGLPGKVRAGFFHTSGNSVYLGRSIINCLLERALQVGVKLTSGWLVWRIEVSREGTAALAWNVRQGGWAVITAKAMVLATGGAGGLYQRHDNPQRMVGSGYALALQAGAKLQDMEFVQFYPLGLAEPGKPSQLVSPRLADQGRLYNKKVEDLLVKYDIIDRPAAVRERDRLSQALWMELAITGGEVWLDLSEIPISDWHQKYQGELALIGEKYQARYRPLRVAPMAHFMIGGVCVNAWGETSLPGLLAAGEVAAGLHGANRLGGNALTETLVFGARAGHRAASLSKGRDTVQTKKLIDGIKRWIPSGGSSKSRFNLRILKADLRRTLWEHGGVIRHSQGLQRGLKELQNLSERMPAFTSELPPTKAQSLLELYHGLVTAELIVKSALVREESRGAHFRQDFPESDEKNWCRHVYAETFEYDEPKYCWQTSPNQVRIFSQD